MVNRMKDTSGSFGGRQKSESADALGEIFHIIDRDRYGIGTW